VNFGIMIGFFNDFDLKQRPEQILYQLGNSLVMKSGLAALGVRRGIAAARPLLPIIHAGMVHLCQLRISKLGDLLLQETL
jgi:hypothetical protein